VVNTLTASAGGADDNDAQAGHLIPFTLRGRDGGSMPEVQQDGIAPTLRKPLGGSSHVFIAETSPTLTSAGHDSSEDGTNRHALVAFNWRGDDAAPAGRQAAPTLDTDESGSVAVHDGVNVRRLTPLEYERLQGFPDGWTIDPDKGEAAPDGPRYAACGDAVAVPVAKWIATRIQSQMEADRVA
jgi:DNA (cytosine-5)-methyltransferase 1